MTRWAVRCRLTALVLLGSGAAACRGVPAPSAPAPAEAARRETRPRLISTDRLAEWQTHRQVVVLDVRTDVFTYLKGHLPGAEYLSTESLRSSHGGIPNRLLSASAYAELFGRLGIASDQPIVIYSAGETRDIDATFVAFLLGAFGHAQVYLLDGGYFKWELEQRPIVQHYPRIPVTRFSSEPFRPDTASLEEVRRAVRTGDALLVDARAPDQYAGEAGAQMRHGHIPGAVNHYWQGDLTQAGFGHVWKTPDELRADYDRQGITPDRPIILYCNSASEASHLYFALHDLLGYPRVRIYVGSWTEWAEDESLPLTKGAAPR